MSFLFYAFISLFLVLCVLLSFVILIQESKATGIGSFFGAGGAAGELFGASTADVLKKFTAWLAVAFLSSCLILSLWTQSMARHQDADTIQVPQELIEP